MNLRSGTIVMGIIVLIFGATRLPQLGRGLGEGISNFKRGLKSSDAGKPLPDASEDDNGA